MFLMWWGWTELGSVLLSMFLIKILSFIGSSIDPRLLDGWQTVADYLLSLFTYFSNYASRFIQPAFPWPRKEREWPHIYSLGHGHLGVCLSWFCGTLYVKSAAVVLSPLFWFHCCFVQFAFSLVVTIASFTAASCFRIRYTNLSFDWISQISVYLLWLH